MNKKLIEECKQAFLSFIEKSSSSLDKNKNAFDERKILLNNIDIKKDEKVKCVAPIHTGNWGVTRNGLLVATNTRIFVLFKKGLVGADVHTFYYKRIASIDYKKTLLSPELTLSTNGDKELTFACHSPDTLGNLLREYMEDSIEESENQNQSQKVPNDYILEQLEKLFKLKESGAISEDEFVTFKQKVLNG